MSNEAFLKEKAARRKTASKAVWLLLGFSALIVAMLVKIGLTGSLKPNFLSGSPTNNDAYEIAKQFVKPALNSTSVSFADDGYQFGKTSDSVYVIKSVAKLQNEGGEPITSEFKITLKYNGGEPGRQKNWSVIDLHTY